MSGQQAPNTLLQVALESFLVAFSHRLRTPLSVIWNDLQYWTRTEGLEEGDRALARCREISELLRSLDPLATPCQQQGVVNWSEIITSSLPSFSVVRNGEEPLAGKQGTPSRIQMLLESLNDLLVDSACLPAGTTESKPCQVELSQTSLRLMCPSVNHGGQSISHSATSFFQNLGIQNSLAAPMVDFICIFENIEADYILENNILTVILHLCK